MDVFENILNTLKASDNEATRAPYWMIVDPKQNMQCDVHWFASMITGPFFSREDAQNFLTATRYNFGPRAVVYCLSGHNSRLWGDLWKEVEGIRRVELLKGKEFKVAVINEVCDGPLCVAVKFEPKKIVLSEGQFKIHPCHQAEKGFCMATNSSPPCSTCWVIVDSFDKISFKYQYIYANVEKNSPTCDGLNYCSECNPSNPLSDNCPIK